MTQPIISYITFETSKEFEKWQKEEQPTVISIVPIPQEMNISDSESNKTIKGKIEIQIFVTYIKKVTYEKFN